MIDVININLHNDNANDCNTLVIKINDIEIAIGNYDDDGINNISGNDEMIFVQAERKTLNRKGFEDSELLHDIRIATNKKEEANE
tara:strand:- start:219 stop:473 length:255 start_codon:yes stop_codon:yes gene_type:complete